MVNSDLIAVMHWLGASNDVLAWLRETGHDLDTAWREHPNGEWSDWLCGYFGFGVACEPASLDGLRVRLEEILSDLQEMERSLAREYAEAMAREEWQAEMKRDVYGDPPEWLDW